MKKRLEPAPIRIRIKRHSGDDGDEDHQGNWKMVYADFATALMVFFLLLWVGAVATDEQRDLLADYFNPVAVSRSNSGADGALSGRSVDTTGAKTSPAAEGETAFPVASPPSLSAFGEGDATASDTDVFEALEADLKAALIAAGGRDMLDGVAFRVTEDGLLIDLMDRPGAPMFAAGSVRLTPDAERLMALAATALARAPNQIRITGHADATPFSTPGYDNVDLSSDRARSARRALLISGLATDRVTQVKGVGATEAYAADALPDGITDAARHRRVTLAVLRRPARSLGLMAGG